MKRPPTPRAGVRAADWRPGQPLSRRALLGGVARGALLTLALPPLEAMFNAGGTAYACDGILPRRFGLWFWGNGNNPTRWTPTGTGDGDAWQLSEQLAPLAAVKSKLCVVTGLKVLLPNTLPHTSGAAGILTATPVVETGDDTTMGAATIDQVIAASIGTGNIYRSLQTAASDCSGMSYNGPNSQNPPECDPYAFYERLFGETFVEPGKGGIVSPTLGLRRSALDAVMADIARLNTRLGAADRLRLERHLEGVRELEQRLAILEENPPNLEACVRADAPVGDFGDVLGRPQIEARNEVMSTMLAMALACDQSRVFAHFTHDPVSNLLFEGASSGHHDLTHNEGGDQPEVNEITIRLMGMLATTIQKLDEIEEGDGTLLDNCAVLACSEVSLGQTHAVDELPVVLAGSACGYFKQDHHYRSYSGENATKLLISLQRAMGMSVGRFGADEAEDDEGLSGVEA